MAKIEQICDISEKWPKYSVQNHDMVPLQLAFSFSLETDFPLKLGSLARSAGRKGALGRGTGEVGCSLYARKLAFSERSSLVHNRKIGLLPQ
jgi:hypothetical protein